MSRAPYDKFLNVSYSGRKLLEKHNLSETGFWKVRGEDSNCDWGGHHHMPELGVFEGTLKDVIEKAVNMPRFWTWGGGGDITKLEPISVTPESNAEASSLLTELRSVNEREKEITARLKELGLSK
jgi:hypothetical protein